MAKKRTNTLSDSLLADFRESSRRVLSAGNAPGSARPFGDSDAGPLWFKADSVATVSGAKVYTGKLYRAPNGTAISTTTVKARNANDLGSGAAVEAPSGVPFRTFGLLQIAGEWFHLFAYGGGGAASGAKRITLTSGGQATGSASGTDPQGKTVTVILANGHGSGDMVWATPVDPSWGADYYVECLQLPAGGQKYQVLQIVDNSGRYGLDWVRAH